MFKYIKALYAPPMHKELMDKGEIDKAYKKYRLRLFLTAYVGYLAYYFVRSTLALAKPTLMGVKDPNAVHTITGVTQHFSMSEVGFLGAALAVAYGLSKFLMGNLSDRSNPRIFLATGLLLSAVINIIFANVFTFSIMLVLMFFNGWAQGMGWPPCGRIMTHWFSDGERGTKMSIWNTAHNVGAGMLGPIVTLGLIIFGYQYIGIFYTPAIISIVIAIGVLIFGKDTPQSVGLPPIEEYMDDYPAKEVEHDIDNREIELTGKEIFFKYVLNNKYVWFIAIANAFVYCVRYGVLNWAPTYLEQVKHFSPGNARWAFAVFEFAAIPGTILVGWMSDKLFSGRRAPMSIFCMIGVFIFLLLYWFDPPGHELLDIFYLGAIGFLIYGPVMLIGVSALDLVPKKAAGTSAGFTGLFGYFIGTMCAEAVLGMIVQYYDWNGGFIMLSAACLLSIVFLALTWNVHDRSKYDTHHEHA
jgi:MFS transporter, OPA family, glycerol-3-phosphate transporter